MEAKKGDLKLTNRQIDVLLKEADANRDHRITFDEFEQYVGLLSDLHFLDHCDIFADFEVKRWRDDTWHDEIVRRDRRK